MQNVDIVPVRASNVGLDVIVQARMFRGPTDWLTIRANNVRICNYTIEMMPETTKVPCLQLQIQTQHRSNSPRNFVLFMCNRRIKSIGRNLSPDAINIHFSRTIPLELILFALIASQCNPTLLPAFLQPSPKHGCYQRERMQNRKQDFRDLR
jgi:hypothetical protein